MNENIMGTVDQPMETQLAENIHHFTSNINKLQGWNYSMRREMQEILPGVWLGPLASALRKNEEQLSQIGITHIISVRGPNEAYFIRQHFLDRIKYLTLDITDNPSQNIIQYFNKVCEFIDDCLNHNGKVLIHGISGISRSASLVVAYVMTKQRCTFEDAYKLVQQKRLCVHLNEGFKRQLLDFELILTARSQIPPCFSNKQLKRPLLDEDSDEELKS